jgi:hypothetical protein
MGAFAEGFSQGRGIVNEALAQQMREREMALREAEGQRQDTTFKNQQSDRDAEISATSDVTGLRTNGQVAGNTSGISNASVQALSNSGGQGLVDTTARLGNQEAASMGQPAPYGLSAPGAPTVKYQTADPLAMNDALFKVAAAKRDFKAMQELDAQHTQLLGGQEVKDFVKKIQDLDAHKTDSPEALAAYKQVLDPYMQAISKYKGLAFDARVNTQTGSIQIIPYDNGPVQNVSLQDALPTLIQSYKLTSKYGDPEKAVQALHDMTKEQHDHAIADTTLRTGVREKESSAITAMRTAGAHEKTAAAAAQNAATNKEYKDQQVQELKDQEARRVEIAGIVSKFDALTPEQQDGQEGIALSREYNMLNAKNGSTIPLGLPRGTGSGAKQLFKEPVTFEKEDDGSFSVYAKEGGRPMGRTYRNELVPEGMSIPDIIATKKEAQDAGVRVQIGENNGVHQYRFIGADGQPYKTVKDAQKAKAPASSTAPVNSAPSAPAIPVTRGLQAPNQAEILRGAAPTNNADYLRSGSR